MSFIIKSKYFPNKENHHYLKRAGLIFLIIFLVSISFSLGMYLPGRNAVIKKIATTEALYSGKVLGKYSGIVPDNISEDINFNLYWKVWDALKSNHVERADIKDKELFYGSLKGLAGSLGDPYTIYMDPKESQDFSDEIKGSFEGIGAEISMKNDVITVVAPLDDSPAAKAGIRAGDKILAIDKNSTVGFTVAEAVNKIRGEKDTPVTLTIAREGVDQIFDLNVTRGTIQLKSVKTEEKDGYFIIRVTSFSDDTVALFNEAADSALRANPKGIILDLRNNPGGYLESAIQMASQWIDEGVIVSEQFSDKSKKDYPAVGKAKLKDYPTVVLVNQGSASAAEIVSGALKDHNKAKLVGKKTFGKGSVQTIQNFSDGSSLKVTIAKWLTPNGVNINSAGIEPDYDVELSIDDAKANNDPQMEKAIEILKKN
jgi:carboxyl-terminal processing protease